MNETSWITNVEEAKRRLADWNKEIKNSALKWQPNKLITEEELRANDNKLIERVSDVGSLHTIKRSKEIKARRLTFDESTEDFEDPNNKSRSDTYLNSIVVDNSRIFIHESGSELTGTQLTMEETRNNDLPKTSFQTVEEDLKAEKSTNKKLAEKIELLEREVKLLRRSQSNTITSTKNISFPESAGTDADTESNGDQQNNQRNQENTGNQKDNGRDSRDNEGFDRRGRENGGRDNGGFNRRGRDNGRRFNGRGNSRNNGYYGEGRYDHHRSNTHSWMLKEIFQVRNSVKNNVPKLTVNDFYNHLRILQAEIEMIQISPYAIQLESAIIKQAQLLCTENFPAIAEKDINTFNDYKNVVTKACGGGISYEKINSEISMLRPKSNKSVDFKEYLKQWEMKAMKAIGLYVDKIQTNDTSVRCQIRKIKEKEYIDKFIEGLNSNQRMKDRLKIKADQKDIDIVTFSAEVMIVHQDMLKDFQIAKIDEAVKKFTEERTKTKGFQRTNQAEKGKRIYYQGGNRGKGNEIKKQLSDEERCKTHPEGNHADKDCYFKTNNVKDNKCFKCQKEGHKANKCPEWEKKVTVIGQEDRNQSNQESEED